MVYIWPSRSRQISDVLATFTMSISGTSPVRINGTAKFANYFSNLGYIDGSVYQYIKRISKDKSCPLMD